MGCRWEVSVWQECEGGYAYRSVHQGQSLLRAAFAAFRAKRQGAGCVKVEWR